MPKCTHKGCDKEFAEQDNKDNACQFHSGAPVFHEGLKGWSCCEKRVIEFDEFLKIPGCTFGRHSTEKPAAAAPAATATTTTTTAAKPEPSKVTKEGVEVYGQQAQSPAVPKATATAAEAEKKKNQEEIEEEEEDDESVPVAAGATCKRKGCGVQYKDDATSRGQGAEAKCVYHPGTPIFHEGSKGWSCCKRRVLEFDEFLKIQGCKEGKHLFVASQKGAEKEELVDCRTDWYQTQTHIILSVFAKNKVDSQIKFDKDSVLLDLKMKKNQRYKRTFPLYASIEPENSNFTVLSTKVELKLKKTSGISWPSLEPSNITTFSTFGITGGGGSVGAKEMMYRSDSPFHQTQQ
ncbi:chord-domain-containing protein [Zychaea mexicana]|uniref:chord-domain-containing protein n=1 Tax=Zychaea mexicana TaxID=64656 RepID=UPI0022FE9957|nr:chord-domain-containing protein [Zychaea mexicana]KAI9499450.1 chord-domain-containing protein [Zychaea mexicana]